LEKKFEIRAKLLRQNYFQSHPSGSFSGSSTALEHRLHFHKVVSTIFLLDQFLMRSISPLQSLQMETIRYDYLSDIKSVIGTTFFFCKENCFINLWHL